MKPTVTMVLLVALAAPAAAAERASSGDPPERSERGRAQDRPAELSDDLERRGIGNTPVVCADGTIWRAGDGACKSRGGVARAYALCKDGSPWVKPDRASACESRGGVERWVEVEPGTPDPQTGAPTDDDARGSTAGSTSRNGASQDGATRQATGPGGERAGTANAPASPSSGEDRARGDYGSPRPQRPTERAEDARDTPAERADEAPPEDGTRR